MMCAYVQACTTHMLMCPTAHMEVETTPCHSSPSISFETGSFVSHIWRFSAVHLPVTEGLQTLPTVPGLMWSLGEPIKSSHPHGKGKQVFYPPRSHLPSSSIVSSQSKETGEQEKSQQELIPKCMP